MDNSSEDHQTYQSLADFSVLHVLTKVPTAKKLRVLQDQTDRPKVTGSITNDQQCKLIQRMVGD